MCASVLPDSTRGRLRWIVAESLVLAGVFLFWIVVTLIVALVAGGVNVALYAAGFAGITALRLLTRPNFLWMVFFVLTSASAALYVLARTGTLIVDAYHGRSPSTRSPL